MLRRQPRSTRTNTLFPYTTLFRSASYRWQVCMQIGPGVQATNLIQQAFPNHGVIARCNACMQRQAIRRLQAKRHELMAAVLFWTCIGQPVRHGAAADEIRSEERRVGNE